MLKNVSYNDPDIKREIDELVGPEYSILQRFNMKGNGSPKLWITKASEDIFELLMLDNKRNGCNVELRPKGIILRFRSILETYGFIVPYHQLTIYKGEAHEMTFYRGKQHIGIDTQAKPVQKFMKKLMELRAAKLSASAGPNSF